MIGGVSGYILLLASPFWMQRRCFLLQFVSASIERDNILLVCAASDYFSITLRLETN